jgi:NADPH:quinone reductase-like Zn-dependent oxidoreductase
MEISGVIESVGGSVEKFRVGDEVFASTGFGGGMLSMFVFQMQTW